jgi:hypothetical protein
MLPNDVPPNVRDKIEKLRGGKYASIVDRLLEKREAAETGEERARVDKLILALDKSGGRFFWVLGLVIASLLGYLFYSDYRHDKNVADGIKTVARVTRLEEGFCVLGSKKSRCMKLTLEVLPEEGAPYAASLTHDIGVEWMSRVQPGSYVTIAVERADPAKVYLDEDALAVEPPKPPAGRDGALAK